MKRRRTSGFTLLELLVAAAISVAVAVTMLGLVVSTLETSVRIQGRLAAEASAQRIFEALAEDLNGAMFRWDGNVWLAATVEREAEASGVAVAALKPIAASFAPDATELTDARFGGAGVWLRFFTSSRGRDPRSGDEAAPVAVAYQVSRRRLSPGSDEVRFSLSRSTTTPAAALAAGFNLSAADYCSAGSAAAGTAGIAAPNPRDILAENVIDFGVRLYRYDANGIGLNRMIRLFPRTGSVEEYHAVGSLDVSAATQPMPNVVDVMLRIATERGARDLVAFEAGRRQGDWWSIASANSYVFTQRFIVMAEAF
ncbi:MAG: hypothetical protein JWM32_61 [Verrucomicrobia bacterium]|nr:hypothetical protein [Verrucomicrobiota bacterium]